MIKRFRLRITACLLIVIMALSLAGSPVEVQAEYPTGTQESQDRAAEENARVKEAFDKTQMDTLPDETSDFTYEVLDDNTLKITDYNGTETDITVPSVIDGKQVTGIGAWVFESGVTSVNLPDSISSIGSVAFVRGENITSINVSSGNKDYSSYDGCLYTKDGSRLLCCPRGKNSVNLRNDLKTIAGGAFDGCDNIKSLVLPEGLTKIDRNAFGNCTSLRSISIPQGVTCIGGEAFWGCSSLEWIEIPDSVTYIGCGVFSDCSSLVTIDIDKNNQDYLMDNGLLLNKEKTNLLCCLANKSGNIIIPDSVTEISDEAFYGCMGLTGIELPNSVKGIGSHAFYGCRGLVGIEIPDSVTRIGYVAFRNCSSLAKIEIPDSVTEIGNGVFGNCSSLAKIEIPRSMTNIPYSMFEGCVSLASIEIPDSVTEIGWFAFKNCSSLRDVYYAGSQSQWQEIVISDSNEYLTNATIHYDFTDASSTDPSDFTYDVLDDGTLEITGYNGTAADITIPETIDGKLVTKIDSYFRSSSSLTSISLPDSLENISGSVFGECDKLTNINVSQQNRNYRSYDGCLYSKDGTKLLRCPRGKAEISFLSGVKTVGTYAFWKCGSLTSISLPDGITELDDSCFSRCISLADISLPDSITDINEYAFDWCSALITISVSQGNNAYRSYDGCLYSKDGTELFRCPGGKTEVSFLSGVKKIGRAAFGECDNLTKVSLPGSVTEIGKRAFEVCTNLTEVSLPDSITKMGEGAFLQCNNLTKISLPDSITGINVQTFWCCYNLTEVSLPDSVTEIGNSAFLGCSSLTNVYYAGSKSQWQKIKVGNNNQELTDAAIHYMGKEQSIQPTGIRLSSKTLKLKKGSSSRLSYTLLPSGVSASVTFTTSNPSVATVDRNGTVTAKKKGTATITAKSSGLTATCKVTVTEEVKLKTPSLTVKLNSANGVKLSWKKVSGAQGYYVYRATSKNGSYKQIKKVKGTSYINNKLKGGKTYYYKVAAYKGSTLSAKSKVKSKKIIGTLKAPKLKIMADKESFTISWNNVKGAEKIEILRAVGNGTFKRWKTISVKKKKESYSNNLLKKGVAYRFALRAYYTIDKKPIYSNRSNALSISR